jgi:Flp pilus assembly protein TadD
MGDTTWRGGDVDSAARFYQAATKLAPNDPVPAFRLGRALQTMGAYKAAADQFRRVLELSPDDGEAKRQLANTLISLDDPQGSIKLFQEIIAENGDHRAFNGLGVALDMTGKHKEALAAYRAGLAKQPESLSLKNNIALSMAIAGNYDDAAKVLRHVAADPRATPRHRQNLALVYGLAGKETAAARIARVDLDGPSVQRNLDYYNWLRQQPRWMVKKMLRNGAPIKPQAASTQSKAQIKVEPHSSAVTPRPATRKTTARKPVSATPRETVRPQTPKRESVSAPRRVDHEGVIHQASLAGAGEPPVRFARLEFGFRPVRDAETPKAAAPQANTRPERVVARVEARQPVVVQPRISTLLPVVVRGNGETPLTGMTGNGKPVVAETPKEAKEAGEAGRAVETAKATTETPLKTIQVKPAAQVVRTQLALVVAARRAEALRNIEARFQHSGLEYMMGKDEPTKE